MAKVKKSHTIRAVGVSCMNGKDYKLNVTGRESGLQLFQCTVPGETIFRFVHLPHVMTKRDAAQYLSEHINNAGMITFLRELVAKYDAILNKVPGKRGRPANEIKASIIPIEPVIVQSVVSNADTDRIIENREKMRIVGTKMKQAKRA